MVEKKKIRGKKKEQECNVALEGTDMMKLPRKEIKTNKIIRVSIS